MMRSCVLVLLVLLVACGVPEAAPTAAVPTVVPPTAASSPTDAAMVSASATTSPIDGVATDATPSLAAGHPRLWVTARDVERLRGWANDRNPFFALSLVPLADSAREDMDAGRVPDQDCGQRAYNEYNTEAYAELFAFMSLIHPDAAQRADFAVRARTLLMAVMNAAAQGPATEQNYACPGDDSGPIYYPPFRDPAFFTDDSDRPRWHGEAFPLTVDWIYGSLTAADKATINTVFTRWGREIIEGGYHHPEPVGVVRDPQLLADRLQVRWSGNNYVTAYMRNLGMMSLALDAADSSPELQSYLDNATGAWLYIVDEALRTEARGGLLPEGFEYSPQSAGYIVQFMLALRTAGEADPARWGKHVVLDNTSFWDDMLTAYLHSLSPTTVPDEESGTRYQVAWFGDAQRYRLTDFIDAFGTLGLYDQQQGNQKRLDTVRWIQTHAAPGGAEMLLDRARRGDYFRWSILYFLLFDPAAAAPADPRSALPTSYVARGMQRMFSRTGWGVDASWLTYALGWNQIDHQQADGNQFEWYRKGEWLTKARVGYPNIAEGIGSSEFRNTLSIQNAQPSDLPADDWRMDLWRRGSQWNYVASGDPGTLATSDQDAYTYAAGDATNLYNAESLGATDVEHASRALVWLKPDIVVVYDRADAPAGCFKRVWTQLPNPGTVAGMTASTTTPNGQHLFVTALLPVGATLRAVDRGTDDVGETVATGEPMTDRIVLEAPDGPRARFLQVYEGADAGASADAATMVRATAGAYEGALVRGTAVLFPVDADQSFDGLTYQTPADTTTHIVSGLAPNTGYSVTLTPVAGEVEVRIVAGGTTMADAAGVLLVGGAATRTGVSAKREPWHLNDDAIRREIARIMHLQGLCRIQMRLHEGSLQCLGCGCGVTFLEPWFYL